MAGSSVEVTKTTTENNKERVEEYSFSWTADDSDGSVPAMGTNCPVTGWVFMGEATTGINPTNGYSVTVTNDKGVDVFGDVLAGLTASGGEQETPKIGEAYGERWVNTGDLTFNLSGNSVNSATGTLVVYVRKAHVS